MTFRLKVLHISTLTEGGAAKAAIRLHESMLKFGIDSFFMTLKSFFSWDPWPEYAAIFQLSPR